MDNSRANYRCWLAGKMNARLPAFHVAAAFPYYP